MKNSAHWAFVTLVSIVFVGLPDSCGTSAAGAGNRDHPVTLQVTPDEYVRFLSRPITSGREINKYALDLDRAGTIQKSDAVNADFKTVKPLSNLSGEETSPSDIRAKNPHAIPKQWVVTEVPLEEYVQLLTPAKAVKRLNDFLASNPRIRKNMYWCFAQDGWAKKTELDNPLYWKSYDNWTPSMKKQLEDLFVKYAIGNKQRMLSLDPAKVDYTLDELEKVYLNYVAHSLAIEIFKSVPWRLNDFPDQQLRWLLDARYFGFCYAIEVDRCEAVDAANKFGFGFVEEIKTGITTWEYFPVVTPALPGDPVLMYNKIYNDLNVGKAGNMAEAVSNIARWCQNNLVHGETTYQWGEGVFTNSNYIFTLYASCEVMLLGAMEQQYINKFKRILNPTFINPRLPQQVTIADLVDQNGVFADPAMGFLDMQGKVLFPETIGFKRHCTYSGCQSTGGLLHWLFKTVNIPAKIYPCGWDQTTGYYPNAFHKGIEVYIGGSDTYIVEHADHFYQETSIRHPCLDSLYYASFQDPYIDLINIFTPKRILEWWIPLFDNYSVKNDRDYIQKQQERYYSNVLIVGATKAFSRFVIDWWKEYERVSRVEADMDLDRIPWIKLLKNLNVPDNLVLTSAIQIAVDAIKKRINEIERGQNTKWGVTLQNYELLYKHWLKSSFAQKTARTLWTRPQ